MSQLSSCSRDARAAYENDPCSLHQQLNLGCSKICCATEGTRKPLSCVRIHFLKAPEGRPTFLESRRECLIFLSPAQVPSYYSCVFFVHGLCISLEWSIALGELLMHISPGRPSPSHYERLFPCALSKSD